MHELSITESILEIALRHAQSLDATRIQNIYLVIGQLSTVVDESVQFYWGLVAEGTIAEDAQLQFRRIAAEMECLHIGAATPRGHVHIGERGARGKTGPPGAANTGIHAGNESTQIPGGGSRVAIRIVIAPSTEALRPEG